MTVIAIATVWLHFEVSLLHVRHQGDRGGCWWWWCCLPELWMLWPDPWLQICVVQELWGNHRHLPLEYRDQGKQVRDAKLYLIPLYSLIFITLILSFLAGPKLFSALLGRMTLAFTPVLSPTLMVLQPATTSLQKVGTCFKKSSGSSSCFFSTYVYKSPLPIFVRVEEAAGNQSQPQIPQWVYHLNIHCCFFF